MRDAVRLYFRYMGVSLRGQMQYRASFIMQALSQFLVTGLDFVGLWALFARFGSLRGWTLPEVALLYGVVGTAWGLTDGVARGFDMFHVMVKDGGFDRLLLRPRNTALQLAGQELVMRRIGRLGQALAVLIWACWRLQAWHPAQLALLLAAVGGAVCLFYGILVVQATTAFWTTESLEVFNTVTYGGVETGSYPMSIYRRWFRGFFTAVVPLACVVYYPGLMILGRAGALGPLAPLCWLAPLTGPLFLLLAFRAWQLGVRHYCSTGS